MRPTVLQRMGLPFSITCQHCNHTPDGALHRVNECPHYNQHRQHALQQLKVIDRRLEFSLAVLVGLKGVRVVHWPQVLRVAAEFLTATNLHQRFTGGDISDNNNATTTTNNNNDNSDSDDDNITEDSNNSNIDNNSGNDSD
jgi:hypothetical protein